MRSLTFKLTLAFLLVCLAGIGLAAAFIWSVNSVAFNRYLQDQRQNQFVAAATGFYEINGSWNGVVEELRRQGLFPPPVQPGVGPQPPQPFALLDQNGAVIVPGGQYPRGEQIPTARLAKGIPIMVNGQLVGTVLTTGQAPKPNAIEQQFFTRTNQALLIAALGGGLIALILGIFLARTLTRPVRDLTIATRLVARGQLGQQVQVRSGDELGELTASFNQMSADLDHLNQSRHQMTADIAHDLRTPLTVISGYVESMRDGVLKPTPERFEAIHAEVEHLQRLVEDLRTLSQADAGELSLNREPVAPSALLQRMIKSYSPLAGQRQISLAVEAEPDLPAISLDPDRMAQVFGNLITNSLRYTPEGGQILLAALQQADQLEFRVQDNGQGIAPEALPYIFDRFYRADEARSGGGESGLGLAIARSIVEAQGGTISAESQVGKGTTVKIRFPL